MGRDRRFVLGHQVADAAHRVDLHRGTCVGQHLTQAMHVDFDGIGADVAGQAEQLVLEQALGRYVSAAAQHDLEHSRLARRE